jgi:hypothetical protein
MLGVGTAHKADEIQADRSRTERDVEEAIATVKGWESARSDQKVSQTGNTTSHHCCGAAKDMRLASGSKTCRHVFLLPLRAHLHLAVINLGRNTSAPQRRSKCTAGCHLNSHPMQRAKLYAP